MSGFCSSRAEQHTPFNAGIPRSFAALLVLCLGLFFSAGALAKQVPSEAAPADTAAPLQPQTQAQALEPAAPAATELPLEAPAADTAIQNPQTEHNAPPPLTLLGSQIPAGTTTQLAWTPSQSFEGIATPTPVQVANGAQPGPVLCLTAAIHGDELNGIETVRRVMHSLKPDKLSGTVIGVPIVNLQGFHRSSRYLPDRRDLNRFFPGNPQGSLAARIAHSFFREIISHCDALVDLHTGSFHRTNMPQLRADLSQPEVVTLTQGFGATAVLHSAGTLGTLRRAATDHGIPAVTLEAGGSMHLEEEAVEHGVKGIQTLINTLGMYKKISLWGPPEPVYYHSTWVRTDQGGILFSNVKLGERVDQGEILGTVTDPITNVRSELISPENGRVLGMALNQVVQPGFAAFRIGIQTSEEQVPAGQELQSGDPDENEPDLAASEAAEPEPAMDERERSE